MDKSEMIEQTVAYIERQLKAGDGALALDDVAERMGYPKFYLNRVFQEAVGMTIHQYILERRLTEAARKLMYTDRPIAEIAYEAGYQSQQSFTNAFHGLYFCAPMQYRSERRFTPRRTPHCVRCGLGAAA